MKGEITHNKWILRKNNDALLGVVKTNQTITLKSLHLPKFRKKNQNIHTKLSCLLLPKFVKRTEPLHYKVCVRQSYQEWSKWTQPLQLVHNSSLDHKEKATRSFPCSSLWRSCKKKKQHISQWWNLIYTYCKLSLW